MPILPDGVERLEEIESRLDAKVQRLFRHLQEAKKQYDAVVTALELLTAPPDQEQMGVKATDADPT